MANIQIRVDDQLKRDADELFNAIGMDTSTAIRAFLKQSVLRQGLPFALTANVPNAETREALREVEQMERDPGAYKGYTDVDEMMRELLR